MKGRGGNGRWGTVLAIASVVAAAACASPGPADKIAACAKTADDACLAKLLESGDAGERARALEALVAMKSRAAVPALLSILLNTLQTGGDGAAVAAQIAAIDAGAVRRAYEEQVASEVAARKVGSAFAAGQHLENARALSKLAGGSTLTVEAGKIDEMKKGKRHAELAEKLVDALENGQLSRGHEIAKRYVEETGDGGVRKILPEIERLGALEDRFYAVAQAQEQAKDALAAAKARGPAAEVQAATAAYQVEKSNMVLSRRALEKERKKLPLITERVREAVRAQKTGE